MNSCFFRTKINLWKYRFLLAAHGGVSIDQAALTGESLPVNKSVGDEIFSGSTCKQGEAEAIGLYTFC